MPDPLPDQRATGAAGPAGAAVDPGAGPPSSRREVLVRLRLLAVLRDRWERRVTEVVAGPGFGKTTLLAQALAENRLDPVGRDVWLGCGSIEPVASAVAAALCTGLGAAGPGVADPRGLVDAIAAAVAHLAPVAVTLVIDDVHLVVDEPGVAELLSGLVERMPATGHLVLSGRRAAPVPLARLIARDEAVRLGEADLAFSDEDLDRFASLRGTSAEALAGAGRWPALVELTASAPGTVVHDFLWEELLATMEAGRRHRLAVLATVGPADQPALRAALDAPVDLDALVADLPLATIDPDGRAELHALWREPLREELSAGERAEARRRLGQHWLERSEPVGAFRLFVEAGAWDDALAVVRRVCGHTVPLVRTDVLDGWLAALASRLPSDPTVLLLRGVLLQSSSQDPAAALPALEAARAGFEAGSDTEGELAAITQLFNVGFAIRDDGVQVSAILRGGELAERGCAAAVPLAGLARAGFAAFGHDYAGAIDALESIPRSDLSDEWNALRDWMHGEQLLGLGEPILAIEVLEGAEPHRSPAVDDQIDDSLLFALFLAGRVDEAVERGRAVLPNRQVAGRKRLSKGRQAQAARFCAYLGLVDEAQDHLARALAAGDSTDVVIQTRLLLARAAVAVASGDEAGAADVLAALVGEDQVQACRRVLALPYVLVPPTRPFWEGHEVGPCMAAARELARALVAVREQRDLGPVASLPSLAPSVVRPALPLPWASELAVAGEAAGRSDARELVRALGPGARPWLERLAEVEHGLLRQAARRVLADIPAVPSETLTVQLLGPFRVQRGDRDPGDWRRERVRDLLGYLAVHPGPTREAVIDALWPDLGPEAGANNLRTTLSYLLRSLQPDRKANQASYHVAQRGPIVELVGHDRLSVDLWEFDRLVAEGARADAAGESAVALVAFRSAAELWRGPFLAESSSAWVDDERERLRLTYVNAACRAAELSLAAGDVEAADVLARGVLDVEPWSEAAYRVVVSGHLQRDQRPAARRVLDRCLAMLDDLGVEPEPSTSMLRHRLAGDHGDPD